MKAEQGLVVQQAADYVPVRLFGIESQQDPL